MSTLAEGCAEATDWPLPAAGDTALRWRGLSRFAAQDLVTGRLVEAHADAVAINVELGAARPLRTQRWGVWAAEVPGVELRWRDGVLSGEKAWCSGATLLTHALVSVRSGEDRLLCAVDLRHPGVQVADEDWAWAGMRAADTRSVAFTQVPAPLVGSPGAYLTRPGFWIGGIGVAACWYGGAAAIAAPLRAHVARHPNDAHAAAHLGAVEVALGASRNVLLAAADCVDANPTADWRRLARRVRATVADTATLVATRVGRALGPKPYVADFRHAQRVADLEIYVRQDHAERDLAALGLDVANTADEWEL